MDLAHCTKLLIDLTQENISKFWGKNEGVCAKVTFAIQNQRYLLNEAVDPKLLQC